MSKTLMIGGVSFFACAFMICTLFYWYIFIYSVDEEAATAATAAAAAAAAAKAEAAAALQLYSDKIVEAYFSCNGTKPNESFNITNILKDHLNNWVVEYDYDDNTILGSNKLQWWRDLSVKILEEVPNPDDYDYMWTTPYYYTDDESVESGPFNPHVCATEAGTGMWHGYFIRFTGRTGFVMKGYNSVLENADYDNDDKNCCWDAECEIPVLGDEKNIKHCANEGIWRNCFVDGEDLDCKADVQADLLDYYVENEVVFYTNDATVPRFPATNWPEP